MTRNPYANKLSFLSVILIIIFGFISYANSLNGEFIWDDNGLVKDNVYIKSWANLTKIFTKNVEAGVGGKSSFYRPLAVFTYTIDYSLGKLNPRVYHFTSLLLHILVALCVWRLAVILFGRRRPALMAGLLFVIHPIHTETVAYISDRADLLAVLFILLTLIFYIKYLQDIRVGTYLFMGISGIFAFLSKENALILPALLLVYHYSFKKKINIKAFCGVSVLTLTYLVLRLTVIKSSVLGAAWIPTVFARVPGFFAAVTNYVRLLFFPFYLHMDYGRKVFAPAHPKAVLGLVITVLLIIYAVKKRRNNPLIFFSVFWFFTALLPVANLCPLTFYMAEHWLYLPSLGFFLLAAQALSSAYENKKYRPAAGAAAVSLLIFYAGLTIKQNNYWREAISFYQRTLQYSPHNAQVHHNLGVAYQNIGKDEAGVEAYKKAIELEPDFVESYGNLGVVYKDRGRLQEALALFKKAIELNGNYAESYNNAAIVYRQMGMFKEAIDFYQQAIALNPDYAAAYYNLALLYTQLGRSREAVGAFSKVLEINPDFVEAYNNLAIVYSRIGDNQKAAVLLKKAITLCADDADLYNNLAALYFYEKDYKSALKYYDAAEKLGAVDPALQQALTPYRSR